MADEIPSQEPDPDLFPAAPALSRGEGLGPESSIRSAWTPADGPGPRVRFMFAGRREALAWAFCLVVVVAVAVAGVVALLRSWDRIGHEPTPAARPETAPP